MAWRVQINRCYIREQGDGRSQSGGARSGRRVLGADDLLPIFIYAIVRSCAGRPGSGWALATLAEWAMAIGVRSLARCARVPVEQLFCGAQ